MVDKLKVTVELPQGMSVVIDCDTMIVTTVDPEGLTNQEKFTGKQLMPMLEAIAGKMVSKGYI